MDWTKAPSARTPSEKFFRERAIYYFRERLRYPLEQTSMYDGLVCYRRAACVDETRLFIRLYRIEQGRPDRPRWWDDRPYHSYSIWY